MKRGVEKSRRKNNAHAKVLGQMQPNDVDRDTNSVTASELTFWCIQFLIHKIGIIVLSLQDCNDD